MINFFLGMLVGAVMMFGVIIILIGDPTER